MSLFWILQERIDHVTHSPDKTDAATVATLSTCKLLTRATKASYDDLIPSNAPRPLDLSTLANHINALEIDLPDLISLAKAGYSKIPGRSILVEDEVYGEVVKLLTADVNLTFAASTPSSNNGEGILKLLSSLQAFEASMGDVVSDEFTQKNILTQRIIPKVQYKTNLYFALENDVTSSSPS